MKKIISFSLWGENPKYTIGAVRNAQIAQEIYPDWICRFYVGESVPKDIVIELKSMTNTEVVIMNEEGDWTGMFWRFFACEDSDVMISRDTDSRLSYREKYAVEEWLSSNMDFHIMRDHPYHKTEILGGMWGCRNGILKNIKNIIESYTKGNFWQVDQNFLREKIYPLVSKTLFIHDSYQNYEKEKNDFPTPRIDFEFVGDVFDENEVRDPNFWKVL